MKIVTNLTSSELFQYKNYGTDKLGTVRCIAVSVIFSILFDHLQQPVLSPAFWLRPLFGCWVLRLGAIPFSPPKKAEQN